MKNASKIAVIGLAIGLVIAISLIVFPPFFKIENQNCSNYDDSSFVIINQDMNRSHTVHISVSDSSRQIRADHSYEMVPGNITSMVFHFPQNENMNNSVTFVVDGNISSHYDNIAVSSDCIEEFYLNPQQGVVRPYSLWCVRRTC